MPLTGKVAIVTGASRGIGQAIALYLGNKGASVVGTATTKEGADMITANLREQNCIGAGFVADVTCQASIEELLSQAQLLYGAPTILINNAGITLDNLLLRMSDADWMRVIDTNLSSIFRMSKICLKGMLKARWGRIINISSVVGLSGSVGQANYAAAKAGMIGFSKSLAQEVASRNITVNVVAPGLIETDMTKSLNQEQREFLLKQVPLGRAGTPEDIAAAVGFLASEEASYITGTTLHVNGGMW